jgi:hypothetical protein
MRANSITRGTLADGRELSYFDDAREAPGGGGDADTTPEAVAARLRGAAATASTAGTEGSAA